MSRSVHHDIVCTQTGETTSVQCLQGDWRVEARSKSEVAWARRAGYSHAAQHRRPVCHAVCVEEPGCLYDGETG